MNEDERSRRHNEPWQKEVLDGMARMLTVLHDISDGVQQLQRTLSREPFPTPTSSEPTVEQPLFFTVNDLADHIGISKSTVWTLHSTGRGPTPTRVGRRVLFRRDDVTTWLNEQRSTSTAEATAWRAALLPGRIGADIPATSTPLKRTYCRGSNLEPIAASPYSGRAVCRDCGDHVLVNRNGLLRKHYPR